MQHSQPIQGNVAPPLRLHICCETDFFNSLVRILLANWELPIRSRHQQSCGTLILEVEEGRHRFRVGVPAGRMNSPTVSEPLTATARVSANLGL